MSTSTLDDLLEAYTRVSSVNRRALDECALLTEHFRQHNIEFLLLKGADLLTRLYGVRGFRTMADIDLLVHEKDLLKIDGTLKALGYRAEIDGNPAYSSPQSGVMVDLTSSIWYLDTPEANEGIWRRAVSLTLDEQPVKGMGSEDLLIYLIAYAVLYRGRLSPQLAKDLGLLLKREPMNWDFILDEASRYHLRMPLYYGLQYARSSEGIAEIPDSVMQYLAPARWREKGFAFLLRKLVTENANYGMSHFLLFLSRPGIKKWQWLCRCFFPSDAFLRWRYGDRGASQPRWTRMSRGVSLFVRAQTLLVKILLLLLKRSNGATR